MKVTSFDKQVLRYFMYSYKTDASHLWGDGWKQWAELYQAEKEIIKVVKKSRILADVKEKYGAVRLDYISAYNGTLKSILQPSVRRNFDCFIYSDFLWEHFPRIYRFLAHDVSGVINKLLKWVSDVDYFIASPHLPFYWECVIRKEDSKHPTMYTIDRWIRNHIKFIPEWWIRWVQNRQLSVINKGYQEVLLRHPSLVHELLSFCDLYKCIKPYGDYIVDGEEIHSMHWKTL